MSELRYPIVLFDVGETLISPRVSFGAVYARVLASLGVALDPVALESGLRGHWAEVNMTLAPGADRYSSHPGGEEGYWHRFVEGTLARTPGSHDPTALAVRALRPLRETFRDPKSWAVYDDVVPVLSALRDAGAKLGIVSNWDSSLPALLSGLDLAGWFDTIVVSHLEGMEKPEPELFLRAVRRLNGEPGRALHVGDVPELDEAGAKAAGIASVIVDRRARFHASHSASRNLLGVPALARDGTV